MSLAVQQFLASTKMTVISHPPYSVDLAPYDFFLFPNLKLKLRGQCFDSTEKIQTELQEAMKMLMQNVFQQSFRSWKSC
jgi:hypothetical protein